MSSIRHILIGAGLATAIGAFAAPAMAAGRCGHSLPVDQPTSLTKVARACNVSLSALREANPGVDPSYVAPGEHLAIPDEIEAAGDVPSGTTDVRPDYSNSYSLGGRIYRYAEYSEPEYRAAPKTGGAEPSTETPKPYYYQASYVTDSANAPVEVRHLSYQKLSAQRIRIAGLPEKPVFLGPASPAASGKAVTVSATEAPTALSPLMECAVLRREPNGKIRQVREVKPMPDGRNAPAHCVSLTAPAAAPEVISTRAAFANPEGPGMVVKGYVMGAQGQCLAVSTDHGQTLYLDANDAARDLVGKEATIWFDHASTAVCGGLRMSRAVYAERLE